MGATGRVVAVARSTRPLASPLTPCANRLEGEPPVVSGGVAQAARTSAKASEGHTGRIALSGSFVAICDRQSVFMRGLHVSDSGTLAVLQ